LHGSHPSGLAHGAQGGRRDLLEDAVHYAAIIVLYQTNISVFLRIFNCAGGARPAAVRLVQPLVAILFVACLIMFSIKTRIATTFGCQPGHSGEAKPARIVTLNNQ
jgi:hypothetical protein